MTEKEYLTISTIATELDCSARTIQGWIKSGKLEGHKLFGRILVKRDYFEEWKQRHIVKKSAG